jgi:hypothetical protein
MDAIALPMPAVPTAMPIPSSKAPLPNASLFGALVAAVAKGEEPQVETSTETAIDSTAPQPDATSEMPPPFVVRQWLAQTDPPPLLPKGLISGVERLQLDEQHPVPPEATEPPSAEPEELVQDDNPNAPVLQFDSPAPLLTNEEHTVSGEQYARATSAANVSEQQYDSPTPVLAQSRETPHLVVPPRPSQKLRLPIQHLIENPSGIGWSAPETQTDGAPGEMIKSTEPRGSSDNPLPARPATSSEARVNLTPSPTRPIVEPSPKDLSESIKTPTGGIAVNTTAPAYEPPKTAHTPDSPKIGEPSLPAASARAPEPLPQLTANAQTQTANTAAPTPDNISVPPPPANESAAVDRSAEAPVKLALVARDGQQTAELQTLALHIVARSARGDSRFTIRLDPPELGRIDVNLSVTSHGHAQAVLAVEKPQTLDLLLRDAPTLERALKDAGLELGSDLSFSLKEEGRPHFTRDDHYAPPPRTFELVPAESTSTNPVLNTSLVEQLYGLRAARLDITV